MPLYQYAAKNLDGKVMKGQMNAPDEKRLTALLMEQKMFLIKCHTVESEVSRARLGLVEISSFCRQVGLMLASGIPLVRAVHILLQRDIPKKARLVYEQLFRSLQQGIGISEAMRELGKAFPELLINMFYSGEASGTLDQVATQMADYYEKEHRTNTKVRNAMIYPIILLVVSIFVVLGIFVFVLPQLLTTFGDMELPLPTKIVMAISDGLIAHWAVILTVVMTVVCLGILLLRNQRVRLMVDKQKLYLPKLGGLLRIIYTARFARTLSSLYSSGITMLNALAIARDTIGNTYIASQFAEVIEAVRTGNPLSESIAKIDGFDSKLTATLLVGEETGQLDVMLNSTADSFEYDSEMAIQRMTALIEPAMIILLAIVIGFVMVAVFLPVYKMYSMISSE